MREQRRLAAVAAALLTSAVVIASLVGTALPAQAAGGGTPILQESFTGATVADPSWIALNQACLTAATTSAASGDLGSCQSSNQAPTAGGTPGYLQLTDASYYSAGGVLYNKALPGNGGVVVKFDQWQYGGNGADGIGFFLSDGSVNLTQPGGNGGSLGYGRINGTPGVHDGYIGVGLDAYGNFTNPTEQRDLGCPADETGPGPVPDAVSIRGPGDGTTGYCWLAGTVDPATNQTTLPGSLRGSDSSDASSRTVEITVSPDVLPLVTVAIDFHDGQGLQTVLSYQMQTPAPATYKLGFVASTGGLIDTHLIRNISVASVVPLGHLNLVKQIDRSTPQPDAYAVGDTIPYSFVVSNTSAAGSLSGITVNDPGLTDISCPRSTLAASDTMVCTGLHTVTEVDATQASYSNTATVTGMDGDGNPVVSNASTATATLQQLVSSLGVAQTATVNDTNGNGVADPGETVTWSTVVTNTGTSTLTDVGLTADRATGLTPSTIPSLAPGASATITSAPYTVTQADVDAWTPLADTVTATGTTPDSSTVSSAPSTVSTDVTPAVNNLTLGIVPTLHDTNGNGVADAGETISYVYTATNGGTATVTGVALTGGRGTVGPASATTLAPGASATFTSSYTVTQADIDAGVPVAVNATATALAPNGPTSSPQETTSTPTVTATSNLVFDVVGHLNDTNGNGVADPGETISYTYEVTNTGTTTVTDTGINSTRGPAGAPSTGSTTIAPGQTVTFPGTYTVTQADIDSGGPVVNTASAIGMTPSATTITTANDVSTVPTIPVQNTLSVTAHTATIGGGGSTAKKGDTIAYSYTVTNTGTTTLTNVATSATRAQGLTPGSIPTLAPGASATITGTYVVTQADIDAGTALADTFSAAATAPGGAAVTAAPVSTSVPVVAAAPTLSITTTQKLADKNGNGKGDVGEVVTYTYVVTNTGNVTMTDVGIDDRDVTGLSPAGVDLAPGQSATFTGTRTLTAHDVASIHHTFTTTARATGTVPSGDLVASPSTSVSIPTAVGGGNSGGGGGNGGGGAGGGGAGGGAGGGGGGTGGTSPGSSTPGSGSEPVTAALAYTGSHPASALMFGVATLLAGIALAVVTRRSRRRREERPID